MARILRVVDELTELAERDPGAAAQQWLWQAKEEVVGCRGQGHGFVKIRSGKTRGKNLRVERTVDGAWQLVQLCRDGCGVERTLTTVPGGTDIELPARFKYRRPKDYSPPKGVKVTRRECFAEAYRRAREELVQEATAQRLAAEEAANEAIAQVNDQALMRGVPPAEFQPPVVPVPGSMRARKSKQQAG